MARTKPKALIVPVASLSQADAALAEIASLKRKLGAITARMNDDIDRRKAEAQVEAASEEMRLASLEGGIKAFAEARKDELFTSKRSVELTFGTIGFRRSKEVKPKAKHTWAMILEKIKEFDFTAAVRVKEDVNREELRGWPEERLDLVGARRAEKDEFGYELNEQAVKEVAG
ncbi:MAG: host-nuclease inhibitor Gam family protein [Pseudomonadota bacterium]